MRTLILSCNTGEGHNACAKAIKEVYGKNGDYCVIEDSLRFISEFSSRFISWGHVFLYRKIPWLFNWGYDYAERNHVFKENKTFYNLFAKGSDNLYKYIINGDYETVISVHPFASLMMTETQNRYNLKIKTAYVSTDYTCSPGVKDSFLDYCFIPDKRLKEEFLCTNIDENKIIYSGIPIKQIFYSKTDKQRAKLLYNIFPENKHIVIACGSMGCGPIYKLVDLFNKNMANDFEITVVCGTNQKLKDRLNHRHSENNRIHIRGYVENMSTLLDSADLYLTKAGGISTTEAVAKRIPMVFINAVLGCESYNSDFFSKIGCAKKTETIDECVEICLQTMKSDNDYSSFIDNFKKLPETNSAQCIYNTLK